MQKFIFILIIIFFTNCSSNTKTKKVIINKTVKVFAEEYHNQAENYIFKWNPPIGPNEQRIAFDLKNDMLIIIFKITDISER